MSAVEQRVRDVAKSCIDEWTQTSGGSGGGEGSLLFKANFCEGKRKDGVSKELFEYMYGCLSGMTCWDASQVAEPWQYYVIYDVPSEALEKDVTDLSKRKVGLSAQLECDAKGNNAQLRISYSDAPPVKLGVGFHATINVASEMQCAERNYVKKGTQFSRVVVESRKTFTFKEHYDWHYTFILRYREPYYDTQDLMSDVSEKDMTFRDPPVCLVQITCNAVKSTSDHQYFADSFLCKISDLLPPKWKMVPFHVHQDVKHPPQQKQG